MELKLNKYGVNSKIKAHLLDENQMRKIGFTDHREGYWHYSRGIQFPKTNNFKGFDISFGVTINKKDAEDLRIDVLDEDFCQPYDYQMILDTNPIFPPCLIVKEQVEEHMEFLQSKGVLSGHIKGEYI